MEDYKTLVDTLLKSTDPKDIARLVQRVAKWEYAANRIKIQTDGLTVHLERDKIQHDKIVATITEEIAQTVADRKMYLEAIAYYKNQIKIRADGKKKVVK
jgi:hypothetical protein